jgi:hypothetical protein
MNKYKIAAGAALVLGLSGLGVGAAVAATLPPTTPPSSSSTPAATLTAGVPDSDATDANEANEPKETAAELAAEKNEPKETAAQEKADAAKDASNPSGADTEDAASPSPSTTP